MRKTSDCANQHCPKNQKKPSNKNKSCQTTPRIFRQKPDEVIYYYLPQVPEQKSEWEKGYNNDPRSMITTRFIPLTHQKASSRLLKSFENEKISAKVLEDMEKRLGFLLDRLDKTRQRISLVEEGYGDYIYVTPFTKNQGLGSKESEVEDDEELSEKDS